MHRNNTARRLFAPIVAATLLAVPAGLLGWAGSVAVEAAQPDASARVATVGDVSRQVWTDARSGRVDAALESLRKLPADVTDPAIAQLRSLPEMFEQSRTKQSESRAAKIAEVRGELEAELAKPETAKTLSAALKSAVELHMLAQDKAEVLADALVVSLVERAEAAARAAESNGEWFVANELFFRLALLMEESGAYKDDVRRLGHRLTMIRLFVPERFWEIRNDARLAEGKDPLPPFNALGESYTDKLAGVTQAMVAGAIQRAASQHVDKDQADATRLVLGGLDFIRTMVTTNDLERVFPRLGDAAARQLMLDFISSREEQFRARRTAASASDIRNVITGLLEVNRRSVKLPEEALIREFGDGAMAQLDEFSAIIWPDELPRFERMTQGKLKGVGIQIVLDDESQMIKVVTPIEGTPAQRAGVRGGDLIKKINGQSAVGISLQQAVELITGEPNTRVSVTMERIVGKDEDGKDQTQDIEFNLVREVIALRSVKGWRKLGAREDQWDWFVDPENKIGYVRLTGFQDETTNELVEAIEEMKAGGLRGLILDLRFNPGGLLNQAVSVANVFVSQGTIVKAGGSTESARPGNQKLRGIPLVVLINEGSASASEIVSGAIKHYADRGDLQAILVGDRTFGKGSVQNVYQLTHNALLKLTTQYYKLPDDSIIHRKPGERGGVEPHVALELLPEQTTQALTLRQEADVIEIDQSGQIVAGKEPTDPAKLITEGIDLQLHYGLVLLQTQTIPRGVQQVRLDGPVAVPTR